MKAITELYANFRDNRDCKIFDANEFLYKEYSVYQPLQRNYALTNERIEKMLQDGVPDSLYNPELQEKLEEKDARTAAALNKEKIGAEFPFTRYFYEYKEPEKADVLLEQFMEMERVIGEKVKGLGEI
jgi:hypothetical protein